MLLALFRCPASKSWGLEVTCIFTKALQNAQTLDVKTQPLREAYLIITQMYLCLTVGTAGCHCPFSGCSRWNVCRPRSTLVVTKLCKYTSTYLQHVDWKRPAFLKINLQHEAGSVSTQSNWTWIHMVIDSSCPLAISLNDRVTCKKCCFGIQFSQFSGRPLNSCLDVSASSWCD